ncbi:MAG: AGE family epimerase/isomerase [Caulobacteraceae bacterium]
MAPSRNPKPPGRGAETAAPDLLGPSRRLWGWLTDTALPLWWRLGTDHAGGGFHEALGQDGAPIWAPRRCRVPPRQIHAFSLAARRGWRGPALSAAEHGLSHFLASFRRPDGLYRASIETDGRPRDDRAFLYDQAFALLGLDAAHALDPRPAWREAALELLGRVRDEFKHPAGGFRERGADPFQSNAQMHLFEACLAWGAAGEGRFADTAGEIGLLCLDRLIDPALGAIDEFYDGDWRPSGPGAQAGGVRRIEPGHQFEWAWLLTSWNEAGGPEVRARADRLFRLAEASVSPSTHTAPGAIGPDGGLIDPVARLWPQTERLRTAVRLAKDAGEDRHFYEGVARDAAIGLGAYLETPVAGLWRDKLGPDGAFGEEPAPASSLYHLAGAIAALKEMVIDTAP